MPADKSTSSGVTSAEASSSDIGPESGGPYRVAPVRYINSAISVEPLDDSEMSTLMTECKDQVRRTLTSGLPFLRTNGPSAGQGERLACPANCPCLAGDLDNEWVGSQDISSQSSSESRFTQEQGGCGDGRRSSPWMFDGEDYSSNPSGYHWHEYYDTSHRQDKDKKEKAWEKWCESKKELERRKRQTIKREQERRRQEEEREQERKERQEVQARLRHLQWLDRKRRETEDKRREKAAKEELDTINREKREEDEGRRRSIQAWLNKKNKEQQERRREKEVAECARQAERKKREEASRARFEAWREQAKSRPKPMPVMILENHGRLGSTLRNSPSWNPVPWRSVTDTSDTDQ